VPLCGFLFSIAGIVAGAVSINQIKRTRERGNGLAIAGIIVGVITLLIWMVGLTYTWG
jgi:drug/metabolite transporter (DMT)-like permease